MPRTEVQTVVKQTGVTDMTNAQIIEILTAKVLRAIAYRMTERGENYAEAKLAVKPTTVAGPAVWAIVDAKFGA